MTYIEIGGQRYEAAVSGKLRDTDWNDRASKSVRIRMSFEAAMAAFVDGAEWSIVMVYEDGTEEVYDNSDYCVAGSVTDHRDGTVTVKMGKITDAEALAELMEVLNA